MAHPLTGPADAAEAVPRAWKGSEEKREAVPAAADADEAVAHAWAEFQE